MARRKQDKYRKLNVKHRRMRSRTEHMRTANRLALCILVIVACVALPVTALSQFSKSAEMRKDLAGWNRKVQLAEERHDHASRELRAVDSDPNYFALKARDKLGWSKEGETILVFPKKHKVDQNQKDNPK